MPRKVESSQHRREPSGLAPIAESPRPANSGSSPSSEDLKMDLNRKNYHQSPHNIDPLHKPGSRSKPKRPPLDNVLDHHPYYRNPYYSST